MVKNNENEMRKEIILVFWLRCCFVVQHSPKHWTRNNNSTRKEEEKYFFSYLIFNCCLSVISPPKLLCVSVKINKLCVCVKINKHSFEPFVCLDLVSECQQSFLFQIFALSTDFQLYKELFTNSPASATFLIFKFPPHPKQIF